MLPFILSVISLALLLAPTIFAADGSTDPIIAEALRSSTLESNLRHLTDEIGGRVTGTPAMLRAEDWGIAAFKAAGADNVYTEGFTIPHSWSEGNTRMSISSSGTALEGGVNSTASVQFDARVVSVAWAPQLPLVKHVAVVGRRNRGRSIKGRRYFRKDIARAFLSPQDIR